MNRTDSKLRLPLIIGSIPFLLAGVDALAQQDNFWGFVNLAMGIINLGALIFIRKFSSITNFVLFMCNSGVAFLLGYNYYLAGKKGLPYAWAVAGIFYIVAAFIMHKNSKMAPSNR